MAWDEDKKQLVIEKYQEANPTPETSMEIVQEIAEDVGESPNGVRMILSKAEVYVKKTPGTTTTSDDGEKKTTRVSKAAAQEALIAAIEAKGARVDTDIIEKMTGKAAQYITEILGE